MRWKVFSGVFAAAVVMVGAIAYLATHFGGAPTAEITAVPSGTMVIEKTLEPTASAVDFCNNIPGAQPALPSGLLLTEEGACVSRELAEAKKLGVEVGKGLGLPASLPTLDFASEFFKNPLVRVLLLAAFIGCGFGAYYVAGWRKTLPVIGVVVLGYVGLGVLGADPPGSWGALLPKGKLELPALPEVLVTNTMLLLVIVGGAVASTFAFLTQKGHRARWAMVTIVLWGLTYASWDRVVAAPWWPFGASQTTHYAVVGVEPMDLRVGHQGITWHLSDGACVDIYDDRMRHLTEDCSGEFHSLLGQSPTYFAASRGRRVTVKYTLW